MTTYEQVHKWFFDRIEKDIDFFCYYGVPENEAIEIAERRAANYREEAIRTIQLKCLPQIDFSQRDENDTAFAFDFSPSECLLVPAIMYQLYINRDFAKLKTYNVNFTSTDMKVFDPSNARKTFAELYDRISSEVSQLIDDYKNTDRLTGKYRTFDVSLYDTEDIEV